MLLQGLEFDGSSTPAEVAIGADEIGAAALRRVQAGEFLATVDQHRQPFERRRGAVGMEDRKGPDQAAILVAQGVGDLLEPAVIDIRIRVVAVQQQRVVRAAQKVEQAGLVVHEATAQPQHVGSPIAGDRPAARCSLRARIAVAQEQLRILADRLLLVDLPVQDVVHARRGPLDDLPADRPALGIVAVEEALGGQAPHTVSASFQARL